MQIASVNDVLFLLLLLGKSGGLLKLREDFYWVVHNDLVKVWQCDISSRKQFETKNGSGVL